MLIKVGIEYPNARSDKKLSEGFEFSLLKMKKKGFYPLTDAEGRIFLFTYSEGYSSDYRYQIVEVDVTSDTWTLLNASGIAPKKRDGSTCACLTARVCRALLERLHLLLRWLSGFSS